MSWARKRVSSFKYAFSGIRFLVKTQPNVWIHMAVAITAISLGFYLNIDRTEWCLILFAIGLVLTAETFNTALEALTDLVSPNYNEKAKIAKDVAAAAVLISCITAAVIGLIVFGPKFGEI